MSKLPRLKGSRCL